MTKLAHVERERAIGMLKANVTPLVVPNDSGAMFGRLDVLRIVSNKLGQHHTVSVQDVDVCGRDVKIETSRRLICAIDFIWSQSQLGHPKELIIQKSGLKL